MDLSINTDLLEIVRDLDRRYEGQLLRARNLGPDGMVKFIDHDPSFTPKEQWTLGRTQFGERHAIMRAGTPMQDQRFVLDTSIYGRNFFTELNHYFAKLSGYQEDFSWCCTSVFEQTLFDIIRCLGLPTDHALGALQRLPDSSSVKDIIISINPNLDVAEELRHICQEHVVRLFIHMKQQLTNGAIQLSSESSQFIPVLVGTDYVVVQECVPQPFEYSPAGFNRGTLEPQRFVATAQAINTQAGRIP